MKRLLLTRKSKYISRIVRVHGREVRTKTPMDWSDSFSLKEQILQKLAHKKLEGLRDCLTKDREKLLVGKLPKKFSQSWCCIRSENLPLQEKYYYFKYL